MTYSWRDDRAIDAAHLDHQQQGTRQLWFLTVAFVMSLLMPILLVAQVPDGGRSSAWMITLVICVWSGLRLAWIISQGKPYLFEFMFWLFVYIFFGLAASVQIRSGDIASTTSDMTPDLDWPTVLFLLGSLLTFESGRLLVRRPAAGSLDNAAGATRINKKVAWILLILGLMMNVYFVSQSGI